jgi:hypothetical protein
MLIIPRLLKPERRWTLLEDKAPYLLFSAAFGLLFIAVTKELFLSWGYANMAAIVSICLSDHFSRLRAIRKRSAP